MALGTDYIIKVQRAYNAPHIPWMFSAPFQIHQKMVDEEDVPKRVKEAMGKDLIAFFKATWNDDSGWEVHERIQWRKW